MFDYMLVSCGGNKPIQLQYYSSDDIEYYLVNAYSQASFNGNIPNFWEIFDAFQDQILATDKRSFCYDDLVLFRGEITDDLLEYILINMKCEFISMLGQHINDCQNILFEEMMPDV